MVLGMSTVRVHSDAVTYTDTAIESRYVYAHSYVHRDSTGDVHVTPQQTTLHIRTRRHVPRTGVMLVGWGGNNGSTLTAGLLAHRQQLRWRTRQHDDQSAAFLGSITQSSTLLMGMTAHMEEVFVPMSALVPMLTPDAVVAVGGWDCNGAHLGEAMRRARVLEVAVQDALYASMSQWTPLPAYFDSRFVAENQCERANHVMKAGTMWEAVEQLRADIRAFKAAHELEKVLVLWTANTERMAEHHDGVHNRADDLLRALKCGEVLLAPSLLYAMAAVLEGCSYLNGAPQNTICPGLVELARRRGVFVAGDDFKSGQTKIKSALVEFFVGAGIKPECIASYNHLGNNDGLNLSATAQFRSKEMTKRGVIDDMVASNALLYPPDSRPPDHAVVIQYLPFVGDSKRAMDEYICSIFMGGQQTVVMHNTCEDSLLAAPLMFDLIVLTELMERVTMHTVCGDRSGEDGHVRVDANKDEDKDEEDGYEHVDTVLSILSYLFKAPAVPAGTPVVNALTRQKQAIENILRALVGLPPENNMMLECRVPALRAAHARTHLA